MSYHSSRDSIIVPVVTATLHEATLRHALATYAHITPDPAVETLRSSYLAMPSNTPELGAVAINIVAAYIFSVGVSIPLGVYIGMVGLVYPPLPFPSLPPCLSLFLLIRSSQSLYLLSTQDLAGNRVSSLSRGRPQVEYQWE